ncbi:hypothetical protein L0244_31570, partial [bacterium]|nr:hypothetical protein [bacterium]
MRAFVHLRQILSSHAELSQKLDQLEKKYDVQFKVVFTAIRELMRPPVPKKRPIGFSKQKRYIITQIVAAGQRFRGTAQAPCGEARDRIHLVPAVRELLTKHTKK